MDNYKPNSHKSREPGADKKIDKPTIGPVKTRKRSELRKITDVFVSDDVDSVKSYIVMDVLIPAAKKTVSDIVGGVFDIIKNSVDIYLYGEDAVRKKSSDKGGRTSYGKYYERKDDRRTARDPRDRRASSSARFDYEDLLFDSRGDVESIIAKMEDVIDEYDLISVATLYNDILDLSAPYTAEHYGWTNIKSAHAERVWDYEERRYRYELKLPKALPID